MREREEIEKRERMRDRQREKSNGMGDVQEESGEGDLLPVCYKAPLMGLSTIRSP